MSVKNAMGHAKGGGGFRRGSVGGYSKLEASDYRWRLRDAKDELRQELSGTRATLSDLENQIRELERDIAKEIRASAREVARITIRIERNQAGLTKALARKAAHLAPKQSRKSEKKGGGRG